MNTIVKKCRHESPRLIDRFRALVGLSVVLHNWTYYKRQNGDIIYFCRKCECGADEVQYAGPCGDGSYRDVNSKDSDQWELDNFNKSEIV